MALHARSPQALARAKTDQGTPRALYEQLDELFRFTVDLAAHEVNAKHARYFSPADDALALSWAGETGWLNPPYGRGLPTWLTKARRSAIFERAIIVQLIPANVGSRWWRELVLGQSQDAGRLLSSAFVPETGVLWLRWEGLITGIHYWPSRIQFEGGGGDAAMFDSALVIHASPNRAPPPSSRVAGSLTWGWPR